MTDERRLSAEDLEYIQMNTPFTPQIRPLLEHIDVLESDIASLTRQIERLEEANRDWPRGSTAEAVERVRKAAASNDHVTDIDPADLRKLFASADGVADSYSQVVSEITGGMLSKPTTDPGLALGKMQELDDEIFEKELRAELEYTEWLNDQFRQVLASEGYNVEVIEAAIQEERMKLHDE